MKSSTQLNKVFWDNRWQTGQTGWDLGAASPPLTAYAQQIPPDKRNLRVLIPGCGNGYEAISLLKYGFSNVTMLDIAPTAIARMQQRLDETVSGWEQNLQLVCTNFFDFQGAFDLILEQTFFCALDPTLRPAYVQKMNELLAPDGKLAGVLFDKQFNGGPPFGGSAAEYRHLFEPVFTIQKLESCYNSALPRAGAEVFFVLKKKLH